MKEERTLSLPEGGKKEKKRVMTYGDRECCAAQKRGKKEKEGGAS